MDVGACIAGGRGYPSLPIAVELGRCCKTGFAMIEHIPIASLWTFSDAPGFLWEYCHAELEPVNVGTFEEAVGCLLRSACHNMACPSEIIHDHSQQQPHKMGLLCLPRVRSEEPLRPGGT